MGERMSAVTNMVEGAMAGKRKFLLRALVREIDRLEAEINRTVKSRPGKAGDLVDELEALVVRAEKLVKDDSTLAKEIELAVGVKGRTSWLELVDAHGEKLVVDLNERLKVLKEFIEGMGIDWGKWPNKIEITTDQAWEMKRVAEEFGFNTFMIVPDELIPQPTVSQVTMTMNLGIKTIYQDLTNATIGEGRVYRDVALKNFEDLLFIKENRGGSRIIMFKREREIDQAESDRIAQGHSLKEMTERPDGAFEGFGLRPMTMGEYLLVYGAMRRSNEIDILLKDDKWEMDKESEIVCDSTIEVLDEKGVKVKRYLSIKTLPDGKKIIKATETGMKSAARCRFCAVFEL